MAYTALIPKNELHIKAGDDASEAALFKIKYDIGGIVFYNDRNTISELKRIYETIKNTTLDLPNFRKTFLRNYVETGRVEALDTTAATRGRSARLYRFIG